MNSMNSSFEVVHNIKAFGWEWVGGWMGGTSFYLCITGCSFRGKMVELFSLILLLLHQSTVNRLNSPQRDQP